MLVDFRMLVLAQACTFLMKYSRDPLMFFFISGVTVKMYLDTCSSAKDCRHFTELYGGIVIGIYHKTKIIKIKNCIKNLDL